MSNMSNNIINHTTTTACVVNKNREQQIVIIIKRQKIFETLSNCFFLKRQHLFWNLKNIFFFLNFGKFFSKIMLKKQTCLLWHLLCCKKHCSVWHVLHKCFFNLLAFQRVSHICFHMVICYNKKKNRNSLNACLILAK